MCVWSVNSQIFRVEEFDFHCREFLNNNKHVIACRMVHRSQNAQIDDLLTFLYTVELERDRQWLNGTQCVSIRAPVVPFRFDVIGFRNRLSNRSQRRFISAREYLRAVAN